MKPLSDPKNDRVVKSVKPPPHKPLSSELLWDNNSDPSIIKRHSKLENFERSYEKRRKIIEERYN